MTLTQAHEWFKKGEESAASPGTPIENEVATQEEVVGIPVATSTSKTWNTAEPLTLTQAHEFWESQLEPCELVHVPIRDLTELTLTQAHEAWDNMERIPVRQQEASPDHAKDAGRVSETF